MGAKVEHASLVDRADRAGEDAATLDEVLLADGLVSGRLVNDRSLVGDVSGRDSGADTVVLVSVTLDHGLDNVVDVVVDNLANSLALVDDAALNRRLSEGCLLYTSDAADE